MYEDSPRIANDEGDLPLHLAIFWGSNIEIIKYLLHLYPEACSVKTNAGLSIHDLARDSYFCSLEIRDLLREQFPKSANTTTSTSSTSSMEILEKDVKEKEENQKKEKEETGKEANYELSPRTDLYKRHAIHKIIKRGDNGCDHNLLEAAKRIIEKEPSCVTLKDEEGETPLHYAAYYGRHTLIPYLLSLYPEAAVAKTVTLGYTPLDLAKQVSSFSNKKCIDMLNDVNGTIKSYRRAEGK